MDNYKTKKLIIKKKNTVGSQSNRLNQAEKGTPEIKDSNFEIP